MLNKRMLMAASGVSGGGLPATRTALPDTTNLQVALSFSLVVSGYSGPCCRIRRADNEEANFGFDTTKLTLNSLASNSSNGGAYDGQTLGTFCSGVNGYIVNLYDQSGNSRDFAQSSTSLQPLIINSGSLIEVGGRACIKYDHVDDNLICSIAGTFSNPYYTLSVRHFIPGGSGTFYERFGGGGTIYTGTNSSGSTLMYAGAVLISSPGATSFSTTFTSTSKFNGSSSYYNQNGIQVMSGNAGTGALVFSSMNLGFRSGNPYDGYYFEFLAYSGDKEATIGSIENNITTFYGI